MNTTPPPSNAPTEAEPVLNGAPVVLAERIEIFPSAPMPHLNMPHAKVYAARARGEQRASCIAVICDEGLPIRGTDLGHFLGCDNAMLLRFRDQGIVDWPLTGHREQVLVFMRPAGQRLDYVYATPQKQLEDEALVRFFIRPLYALLRDLTGKGTAHGNIHLGNIFNAAIANGEAQIGEAISAPPSYNLPNLYCSIERAQCHPAGRGTPSITDDIYAAGMSALIMAIGFNPWAHLNDIEILKIKLEKGSYFGLAGEQHLRGTLVELFRGMLDDNPRTRWTLNDIETWLSGRRPQSRQSDEDSKGSRGLTIGGGTYNNLRSVAHALIKEPILGAAAIESGEVEKWLQHSLNNEKMATTLKRAVAGLALSRAPNANDMMVTRTAMVLDSAGPVRYHGLAMVPSGAGYLLATLMAQGGNIQTVAEILSSNLCQQWVEAQEEGRADHLHTLQQIEQAQAIVQRRGLGFGLERVVYELLPALPCMASLVKNYACRTVHDLLFYLDQALGRGMGDAGDRHIMGFLLARERRVSPQLSLALANQTEGVQRTISILRVLAEMQNRHGPDRLNNLTSWMVGQLEPATKRFFEKTAQDRARVQLQAAGKDGKLAPLVSAVDDGSRVDRDRDEFERARHIYAAAARQITELQMDVDRRKDVEIRVGQPIASAIAALIGFAAIGLVILLQVVGIKL